MQFVIIHENILWTRFLKSCENMGRNHSFFITDTVLQFWWLFKGTCIVTVNNVNFIFMWYKIDFIVEKDIPFMW